MPGRLLAMKTISTNSRNLRRVCFIIGLVMISPSANPTERRKGHLVNLNWTSLQEEVMEMLSGSIDCLIENNFCEVPFVRGNNHNIPHVLPDHRRPDGCGCHDQCMTKGECCIDEAARRGNQGDRPKPEEIVREHLRNTEDSIRRFSVVRYCHESFVGTKMESLCFQQPSDVLYDPLLELPVISSETAVAYLNYYCAQCNNDAMDLSPISYNMECVTRNIKPPVVFHKRGYSVQFPSANDFANDELSAPQIYLAPQTPEDRFVCLLIEPFRCLLPIVNQGSRIQDYISNIRYTPGQGKWEFFTNPDALSYTCIIKEKDNANFRDKVNEIRECNAAWENKEDFEKCRSYSLPVKQFGLLYKNPHCARCNFQNNSRWNPLYCYSPGGEPEILVFNPTRTRCEPGWKYNLDNLDCKLNLEYD